MAMYTLMITIMVCSIWQVSAYKEVRLSDGTSKFEGRVEILHAEEWGTVCNSKWEMDDATVVCNQLGFPLATLADRSLEFGPGNTTSPVWMNDVQCKGYETSLDECEAKWSLEFGPGNTTSPVWMNDVQCKGYETSLDECEAKWSDIEDIGCTSHNKDVGVICSPIKEGAVRLFGAKQRFDGGVEFYHSGAWGTVCDHGWSSSDAKVVCRQLGYGKAKYAIANAWQYYGFPNYKYNLEDVDCEGYEAYLIDCWPLDFTPGYCDAYDLAGVYCYENDNNGGDNGELSPEAIAGIVIASVFALLIFMCICAAVCSSKKKKRATNSSERNRENQIHINAVYSASSDTANIGAYPYPTSSGAINTVPFTPPAGYAVGYMPPGANVPPPEYNELYTTMPMTTNPVQPPPFPSMASPPAADPTLNN